MNNTEAMAFRALVSRVGILEEAQAALIKYTEELSWALTAHMNEDAMKDLKE